MKPIQDKQCSESENVTFEAEVSHSGIDAFWTFKRQPLKAGPKYKMESKDKCHTLTVIEAMKDEEGEYMFAAGEKMCSAILTVTGKTGCFFFIWQPNKPNPGNTATLTKNKLTETISCHKVAL